MSNDYNGIGLPTVISLIKKLGGNGGGGVGGDYLPLSGGTMSGDVTFKNNLNINGQTVAGVPKNMVCLSNEDRFILGSEDVITHLYSEHRPYLHVDGTTQQIAYLSDVIPKASISIVETLPQSGETNVLYFVKDNVENVYAIFLWDDVNKIFVLAGDSNLVLDDYYNKTQIDSLFLAKSGGYMNGEIDLANNIGIIGFTSNGDKVNLIKLNSSSIVNVGDATKETTIFSKNSPSWNNGVSSYNFITSNGGLLTNRLSLANNVSLMGKNLAGQDISLIKINNKDEIVVGSDTNWLKLSANNAPLWSGQGADTPLATETYIANNYLPLNGGVVTGTIGLSNNIQLYGISTDGSNVGIAILNENNTIIIGSDTNKLHLRGNARPEVKVGDKVEYMALLSDITSMGSDYLPLAGGTMAGNETFNNNVGVYGTTTSGQTKRILMLNNANNLIVGEGTVPLQFSTSTRPKVNTTGGQQELAYLSDINSSGSGNYLPLTGGEMTGNITFNTGMLYGKSTEGELIPLVGVANGVNINVGGTTRPLMLQSSQRPSWNNGDAIKEVATLDDIPTAPTIEVAEQSDTWL